VIGRQPESRWGGHEGKKIKCDEQYLAGDEGHGAIYRRSGGTKQKSVTIEREEVGAGSVSKTAKRA